MELTREWYDQAKRLLKESYRVNCFQYEGKFTPEVLAEFRMVLASKLIVPTALIIYNAVWTDMVINTDWHQIIDPVSKHADLLAGELGQTLGLRIKSDAYMHPSQKFMKPGEIILVGVTDKETNVESLAFLQLLETPKTKLLRPLVDSFD